MGAELIAATTTMPHGIDGRLIDLDPENIRSTIESLVSPKIVENVNQYCSDSGRFDYLDDPFFEDTELQDAYRNDDLAVEENDISLNRDDVVTMLVNAYRRVEETADINPVKSIATVAEMSWGDAPEGFDEVCLLAESCVFDKPIYDPATLVIPEHLSDVVRAYADTMPEWDSARAGLLVLAETVEMLDHDLSQPEVERVFRALVLREGV